MSPTSDPKSRRRGKKERVKTARGRTLSSTRWLQRQLNDPYVAEARRLGYRSRSAFKLKEINEKYNLFKGSGTIVDLGSAPGGWCQVLRQVAPKAKIIALDLQEFEPIDGVDFILGDFLDQDVYETVLEKSAGGVDAVLSDMANPSTGHRKTDHIRTMGLAEAGFEFAKEVLNPGGLFLTKVLRGGGEDNFLNEMKQSFTKVRHIKPPSSRADSRELFVLATGFKSSRAK